jgi:hypothetical protein
LKLPGRPAAGVLRVDESNTTRECRAFIHGSVASRE